LRTYKKRDIKEALLKASSLLKEVADRPFLEASILLCHLLKKDRIYLALNEDKELKEWDEYFKLVKRREKHEPIEYITNKVSFYSRTFHIERGVLIPRPETEILVEKSLEILKRFPSYESVAEIGVGSGAVSVSLALSKKNIKITATDISMKALKCAKINAEKFKVANRIRFVKTSYLEGIKQNFDIIVSNPPYIRNDFKVDKNLLYEPKEALFGGERGDEILKEIVILAKERTKHLVCEMGYDQKDSMESFFKENDIKNYSFYKDLSGFDRGFIINFGEK